MGRQYLTQLFLLLLALFLLCPFAGGEHSAPGIAIVPGEYDLGEVGHGDRILGIATITNPGRQQCTIRSVRSNCACYKVPRTARTLLPGESILVEFDLTFPEGKELYNPVIYFLTDDKEKPMRTLLMKMSLSEEKGLSLAKAGEIVIQVDRPEVVEDGFLDASLVRPRGAEIGQQTAHELGALPACASTG